MIYHQPVLASEITELLDPKPGKIYLDATLGNGGHTIELLKTGATVYGLDADPKNLQISSDRIHDLGLSANFVPILGNFVNLAAIYQQHIKTPLNGILFDLGLSQNQLTTSGRGFSYNDPDSLDMRLDPDNQTLTAENIINTYSYQDLYQIFTKYSQETLSKPIITDIIRERQKFPIKTSTRLAEIIRNCYHRKHLNSHIDAATKIFMALRIAVNNELENLKLVLPQVRGFLSSNGLACFISFHSGEDRTIKIFIKSANFSQNASLKPSTTEIKNNPLSRSATLRWFRI